MKYKVFERKRIKWNDMNVTESSIKYKGNSGIMALITMIKIKIKGHRVVLEWY